MKEVSEPHGKLLEMQMLGLHPRLTKEFREWGPTTFDLISPSGDSDTLQSLRVTMFNWLGA